MGAVRRETRAGQVSRAYSIRENLGLDSPLHPCAERLPKAMRLVALASAVVMAAAMDMPPRARKQPMRAPAGTHHKQAHSIGRQPAGACGAGLALVHIGKAGGSSVSANLRMGCHAWWAERYGHGHCPHENRTIQNESELSMQVVAYWHVHTVPVERYARFVVMVRNR